MTSRADLLAWLNDLLQLNYTKVEQCGSGAAYVQVIDSIYGDINMTRIKFNAKHEYEYVANFKVLQNVFKAKQIPKPIPVEALIKCKMQDNLEFLQWIKRFWDTNYGGQGYDPVGRRKGAPAEPPATTAPIGSSSYKTLNATGGGASRASARTPVGGRRTGSAQPNEAIQTLTAQIKEMSGHLEGLEKERDFYFEKLREIEILVQTQVEALEAEGKDDPLLKDIQKILYSTEEGFEVPDAEASLDEEETF